MVTSTSNSSSDREEPEAARPTPSHESLRGAVNLAAVASLFLGNLVTTIDQVNVASTFSFISDEFSLSVYGLGILTSAFFLAYGVFEVPGGIFAAKVGPRKIALAGTLMSAIGSIGSAASPDFTLLTVFRFFTGFGFAFAFPSLLVLIVRYYRKGSEGFGVALMSISSSGGSLVGLFGWAVLASRIGWRVSLLASGALGIVVVVLMVSFVPPDRMEPEFQLRLSHMRSIVSDRSLAVLSASLFGAGATYGIVTNFMVYYLEGNFGLSPGLAGLTASVSAVFPMISAPLTGRAYDRVKNVRVLLLGATGVVSLGTVLTATGSVYGAVAAVVLVGLGSGTVFTVGLAAARELASHNRGYEALTVGWVDSFSLLGNVAAPLYFSALVLATGYSVAWLIGGVVAVLLTLPVLTIANERFGGTKRTVVVAPSSSA